MKKSIDRCADAAREKYEQMCGTGLEQACNKVEAGKFSDLVDAGIVIATDDEYTVLEMDVDKRFLRADCWFLSRYW